ncbi:hypothetical protein PENSPDRAFT_668519 [Peniophora sp. CONT]|nr:hypothetical protein PENSPDRAFT_668519 [Peniophora sp. CONT]
MRSRGFAPAANVPPELSDGVGSLNETTFSYGAVVRGRRAEFGSEAARCRLDGEWPVAPEVSTVMGLLNYIARSFVSGKEAITRISSASISDFRQALLLEDQPTYNLVHDAPVSESASTSPQSCHQRSVPGGKTRDSAELEELQARRIQREWGWSLVAHSPSTLSLLITILICLSDPAVQHWVAIVAATMIPGLFWNMGAYFSATTSSGPHMLQKLVVDVRSNRRGILLFIHLLLIFAVFSVGAFLVCTLTLLYAASPTSAIVVAVPATIAVVAGVVRVIIGGVHSEDASMPGAGGV